MVTYHFYWDGFVEALVDAGVVSVVQRCCPNPWEAFLRSSSAEEEDNGKDKEKLEQASKYLSWVPDVSLVIAENTPDLPPVVRKP